jgi:hypothetical protein
LAQAYKRIYGLSKQCYEDDEDIVISLADKKKLAKLAAGWCTNEERRELIRLLQQQPDLIPARVREIRILRESPK